MNVLITGGNGFLGYNITNLLLNEGHNVLVLSRSFNRFDNKQVDNKQIKYICVESNTYYTYNTYNTYKDIIVEFAPDTVIHFAWAGGNNYKDVNHVDQYNINIPSSISLLETINSLPKKPKFIGVGSFAEYGMLVNRATEEYIEKPVNHYGLAKNVFKNISKLFCATNNIQWLWIRPCYIYGEGDVDTRFLPSLITRLKRGEHITLDSCDTIIDYLHVDDFSKALLQIIQENLTGIYNICSGNEYHLKDIINYITDTLDVQKKIIFDLTRDRIYSSKYICGDNTKLREHTTWTPEIDIYKGIHKLI
jgi:dTDP-6-deoxy-L-talose 4-dehydrogenase (NAD+)